MTKAAEATLVFGLGAVCLLPTGCYNFYAVKEGRVYRSAQPFSEDVDAWVETYGIRSVLKLNGAAEGSFWHEQSAAPMRDSGGTLYQIGLSATRYPTRDELLRVWAVLDKAEYPLLIHCREGADRTGLVSAIAVLHGGGTMQEARDELSFWAGHTGIGTWAMDAVLDLYEPWYGRLTFGEWAATEYEEAAKGDDPEPLIARQRAKAAASRG